MPKKKKAVKKKAVKKKPVLVDAGNAPGSWSDKRKEAYRARRHTETSAGRIFTMADEGWSLAVKQDRKSKGVSTVSVHKKGKKAWTDSKAKRDARGWANALQKSRNR